LDDHYGTRWVGGWELQLQHICFKMEGDVCKFKQEFSDHGLYEGYSLLRMWLGWLLWYHINRWLKTTKLCGISVLKWKVMYESSNKSSNVFMVCLKDMVYWKCDLDDHYGTMSIDDWKLQLQHIHFKIEGVVWKFKPKFTCDHGLYEGFILSRISLRWPLWYNVSRLVVEN